MGLCNQFWQRASSRAASVVPSPASVVSTAIPYPDIVVQAGDTLGKLGQIHGFDWRRAQIARAGQIHDIGTGGISPDRIEIGDKIIPEQPGPGPTESAQQAAGKANTQDPECTTGTCCDHPVWLETAKAELGVKESKNGSNARIEEYHDSGWAKGSSDSVAWCASFVNWVFEHTTNPKTGKPFKSIDSAGARHYLDSSRYQSADEHLFPTGYGEPTAPFVGAVVAFIWKAGKSEGHVGYIVGETPDGAAWWVLGGNQSTSGGKTEGVTVSVYSKTAGAARDVRKPPNFNPCEQYKTLPKNTAEEARAKFGHLGRVGSYANSR